jgi:hypothetical protein
MPHKNITKFKKPRARFFKEEAIEFPADYLDRIPLPKIEQKYR